MVVTPLLVKQNKTKQKNEKRKIYASIQRRRKSSGLKAYFFAWLFTLHKS